MFYSSVSMALLLSKQCSFFKETS